MKQVICVCALLLSSVLASCSNQQDQESASALKPVMQAKTDKKPHSDALRQGADELAIPVQQHSPKHPTQLLVGTWVSEEDTNWKLAFTPEGTCRQYYQEELLETDSFSISNTSPQCDEEVHLDATTNYLRLENLESHESTCYELNSLSADVLSLRPLTRGGILVFAKEN